MAKTVLLVPRAEMLEQAEKLAANYHLDFLYMKVIRTGDSVEEAEKAVKAGADIIIARGVQAMLMKKQVSVPVVEIMLTGQEMGQNIVKAKSLTMNPSNPVIGLVGFGNMFCDMSSFDKLYEVNLQLYFVEESHQLLDAAKQAYEDGVEAMIGGDVVCEFALSKAIPAVFQTSGPESIAEVFRVAERVNYAIDQEKRNTAELKVLLDYYFNGIIKIDNDGIIVRANHFVEKLFFQTEEEMIGKHIQALTTAIDDDMLEQVLLFGQEVYSTAFVIKKTAVAANIAPILIEGEVQGAIISFQEGQRLMEMEADVRRELFFEGHVASCNFEIFPAKSAASRIFTGKAKSYAGYDAPILMVGGSSGEREMLAQCIHNEGIRHAGPYVSLFCGSLPAYELEEVIFGSGETTDGSYRKGLLKLAEGGTLFLDKVSLLDSKAQYRLAQLAKENAFIHWNDYRLVKADVRIIAGDGDELRTLTAGGAFLEELYYALNVLPLTLTPLALRTEDIQGFIQIFIAELEKKYQRYIHLTAGAMEMLLKREWSGNPYEIYNFCKRMFFLSPRRTVNEKILRQLMEGDQLIRKKTESDTLHSNIRDLEKARLIAALEKHHGKRKLVAQEMGMSVSTLWRHMKKYDL